MISRETASAGGGASSAPPMAPKTSTASASTMVLVRMVITSLEYAAALRSFCLAALHGCGAFLLLLSHHKVAPAILVPAFLVMLRAERVLFAPAHCFDAVTGDTERDQILLGCVGAPLPEAQVVFFRAPLVAMALDGYADLRVGAQKFRVLLQGSARIGCDVRLVVIEIGVLYVLGEQSIYVRRGSRRWSGRGRSNRDCHVGRCRSAGSRRRDCVSRRVGRADVGGSFRSHLANPGLQVEIRSVGRSPSQRRALARLKRCGC